MRTYNINGKEVQGESVEFSVITEPFAVYQLKEGSYLKAKTIVLKIIRLEEKNPVDGSNQYFCTSQFVISADD